ncbi:hypothetical protein F5Y17DRAFT_409838 [Xylariaceae sp. FL0594]|nr:hypothetical protein F5Y17DRAFT_409838 [Xylariaceae sp. FL0594]
MDSLFARDRATHLAGNRSPKSPCPSEPVPRASLLGLPLELQLQISQQLTYPDALSLKHTSRNFFYLVDTGVKLKVDWLMERGMLRLQVPKDRNCDLRSDDRFCRGTVSMLMRRRRAHLECESRPGLGCLVLGTTVCAQRRSIWMRWRCWLRLHQSLELWGLVLFAVLPVLMGFIWLRELASIRAGP